MYMNNNGKHRNMNITSSRSIVEDYIRYRLSKHNIRWQNGPLMEAVPSKEMQTMRALGDEFEERYRTQFENMGSELQFDVNTAHSTFRTIVNEIFKDGVNWGRIVALFSFGGSLAMQCYNKNMPQLVSSIVDWIAAYVDNNLQQWIAENNGWAGLVEFYDRGERNESPWPSLGKLCGLAAGALGVLTLAGILVQKS